MPSPTPGQYADRHGTGAARRRFAATVDEHAPHIVRAEMEDEMHHFRISLHHDGEKVVDVTGTPVRWPWSPCFDSPESLRQLIGCPLTTRASEVGRAVNVREQCTHQFDLAVFAIAHAWRNGRGGAAAREYLTVVPDWSRPPFSGYLWRDRVLMLAWLTDGQTVLGPAPFTGVALRSRFLDWCETNLDADLGEAAQMLRRAVWISPARTHDLEGCDDARDSHISDAVCYTAQPARLTIARRSRGSLRDYSNTLLGLSNTIDA